MLTGIQSKFDWGAVALNAIGSGIGAGLGTVGILNGTLPGDIVRGALGNALTQGIGVATGLQKKFDWAGVAAAGVSSGASALAGGGAAGAFIGDVFGAATRSIITGTDFGDNLLAVLPSVIGATIGNAVALGISGSSTSEDLNQLGYGKYNTKKEYGDGASVNSLVTKDDGSIDQMKATTAELAARDDLLVATNDYTSTITEFEQKSRLMRAGEAMRPQVPTTSADASPEIRNADGSTLTPERMQIDLSAFRGKQTGVNIELWNAGTPEKPEGVPDSIDDQVPWISNPSADVNEATSHSVDALIEFQDSPTGKYFLSLPPASQGYQDFQKFVSDVQSPFPWDWTGIEDEQNQLFVDAGFPKPR